MPETADQIRSLAQRHNLSEASVRNLVDGLLSTGGAQVQFNVPEFGGFGQWMPGMVMAGSLFDTALKARVEAVCADIAQRVRSGELRPTAPSGSAQGAGASISWSPTANWWPGDLGIPSTSGAQNNMRYAWFPQSRRLAVDLGGSVWVYDTGDHQIGGVSQQQSGQGMTLTFTSQHGVINLASLPVVSKS